MHQNFALQGLESSPRNAFGTQGSFKASLPLRVPNRVPFQGSFKGSFTASFEAPFRVLHLKGLQGSRGLLGGSWGVISGVISRVTVVKTHIRGLITPLITTLNPIPL